MPRYVFDLKHRDGQRGRAIVSCETHDEASACLIRLVERYQCPFGEVRLMRPWWRRNRLIGRARFRPHVG